jgi:molybdopterin-guanine dinucleotide biosynthesis protein A
MEWAAVVLSGGGATRLDGADKSALEHDGRTLLDHALAAVSAAGEVVVVGPDQPTSRPVTFTREVPAGGGPLAGLSAGVAALAGPADLVLVLAVDMPHVTDETVARLVGAMDEGGPGLDGAWLVDDAGRRQLAGVVRRALVPAPGDAYGVPMRRLMERERTRDVAAKGQEAQDIDTWEDLSRLREGRIRLTPRTRRT